MKIRPLGAELFHADIQMDRQTNTKRLKVPFAILGMGLEMSCSSWVDNALARLGVTEKSGNLRNDLRKDILEAKTAAHKELEREIRESREEIQRLQGAESNKVGQVMPPSDQIRHEHRGAQQLLLSEGRRQLYSEAAKAEGMVDKRYN
jgi:hypothetical protein